MASKTVQVALTPRELNAIEMALGEYIYAWDEGAVGEWLADREQEVAKDMLGAVEAARLRERLISARLQLGRSRRGKNR